MNIPRILYVYYHIPCLAKSLTFSPANASRTVAGPPTGLHEGAPRWTEYPGSKRTRAKSKTLMRDGARWRRERRIFIIKLETERLPRGGGGLHPPYISVFSAAAKCAWLAGAVAAMICGVAGTAVQGQTGASVADDRAAVVEAICRQYAAALTDMPADLMFKECISERHCRPVPSPPGYWCEPPQPMQVKTWLMT